MRQFFTIFLACVLAILFSFFILGIFFVGIASAVGSASETSKSVDAKSLLRISSGTQISSIAPSDFESVLSMQEPKAVTLRDAIYSIQKASDDDNIAGILLEVNKMSIEAAYRNELMAAIDSFKKKGKKVYAYGTNIDQGSYHLATAADSVFIHPRGMLLLLGYAADITFYKGLMDKLGIAPQIFYAGDFKSATEPYRLKKMSDPNRLQISELLDDFWDQTLNAIEKSRKLDSTQVANIINNGDALIPEDAHKNKLVDGILYQDELENLLRKELDWDEEDNIEDRSISLVDYKKHASSYGSDVIALLHMDGEITGSYNPYAVESITAEEYLPEIEEIADDDKIKAVVLHINSPGGDAIVSDKIWHAIQELDKKKPVVAYMSSVAASGGYYIAAAARHIVAQPRTITGSIGVFMMSFNAKKLLEQNLGLSFDGVKKGNLADYGTLNREMTPNEKKLTQKMVDQVYERFLYIVKEGRNLPLTRVKEIAKGRVYSGTDAKAIGLVDKLGLLESALNTAANYAEIKDYKIKELPVRENSPLQSFLAASQTRALKNQTPKIVNEWLYKLQHLQDINGKIMALPAYEIQID